MAVSQPSSKGNVFAFDRSTGAEIVISGGDSISYSTHTHVSTLCILLVRDGRIRLFLDSSEHYLEANHAVVIQPHRVHRLQSLGRFTLVTLCLKDTLFTPGMSVKQRNNVKRFLNAMFVDDYLSKQEENTFYELARKVFLSASDSNDSLSLLRKSLEDNPENPVTLDDMAQAAHIEKCHLIRRFKARYGITPHTFITQNRLRKARRHLVCRHSLTESALMSGFYDQSHFIRNFKKLHGITPSDYLRACHPVQTAPNTTEE